MGAEAPVSIVCLCGPTCSGKTTLVTFLKQTLALQKNTEVITIAQDDFYKVGFLYFFLVFFPSSLSHSIDDGPHISQLDLM
jgi:energy-coupling factor transporter ATP-binding protein EcfA2